MFKKAERKRAKLRLGISGISGSGKTWSSLEIAHGMGGKVALIDTESGRGELYGNEFNYDVLRLDAPYSVEKYIEAIKSAEKANYDILIIDSLSHAWAGEGGILSVADKAGGSFTAGWKQATPKHNLLIDTLITSKLHLIVTVRTKTEYILELNEKGKQVPRKVGMAPVQRDNLEYEFTVWMEISNDHTAHITKDNTRLFDQQFITPTKKMGEQLMDWLNQGIIIPPEKLTNNSSFPEGIIFGKNEINLIKENINACPNLDSLLTLYKEYYIQLKNHPEALKELIKVKDERKAALEFLAEYKDEPSEETL